MNNHPPDDRDDLDKLLSDIEQDPTALAAFQDREQRTRFLSGFRRHRVRANLSQRDVAERMLTRQSSISEFESAKADPQLSTLQRAARAVGRRLEIAFVSPQMPVLDDDSIRSLWRSVEEKCVRAILQAVMVHARVVDNAVLAQGAEVPENVASRVIQNLIDEEWLIRGDDASSVSMNPDRACIIGVNVSATRLHLVVTDLTMARVSYEESIGLFDETPDGVVELIVQMAERALARATFTATHVLGVGVAFAGIVEAGTGNVLFAPNLRESWTSFPLEAMLQERLKVRVVVENDANALATYEYMRSGDNYIVALLVTNGLGSSILVDGRVLYGTDNAAGELGHMTVAGSSRRTGNRGSSSPPLLCRCGRYGCLETIVSEKGILQSINQISGGGVSDLADTAKLPGQKKVLEVFGSAGTTLGAELASMIAGSNPSQIFIYGPPEVSNLELASAQRFLDGVKAGLSRQIFTKSEDALKPRILSREVQARSATAAVAREFLNRPWVWEPSTVSGGTTSSAER